MTHAPVVGVDIDLGNALGPPVHANLERVDGPSVLDLEFHGMHCPGHEVTDDAHGTRYITFGGAGAPLYRFLQRQPWVHGRESTHGYGILTVSLDAMRWDAYREDGSLIETIEIPH